MAEIQFQWVMCGKFLGLKRVDPIGFLFVGIEVLQTYMVPLNGEGRRNRMVFCQCQPSAHRPMVQSVILSLESLLEPIAVFAEIMQQACEYGFFAIPRVSREFIG
jgi:hypothetical protein